MGSEPDRRSNLQIKGAIQQISYLIQINKIVKMSAMPDFFTCGRFYFFAFHPAATRSTEIAFVRTSRAWVIL